MKNRRDFLKSLLGVALVAPAIAACRTIVPEPFDLPAYGGPAKTMLARYRTQQITADQMIANYRRMRDHVIFPTRTWRDNIEYQEAEALVADYRRAYPVFPNHPVRPWLSARYWK